MICLQTLKVKCVPFCAISSQTRFIHFPKKKKRSTTLPQILKENPRVIRATSASFASTLHYWESIIVTEVAICHGVCIPRRQRSEGLGKERCSTVQTVPCYVWCCSFVFLFFFLFVPCLRTCRAVVSWCVRLLMVRCECRWVNLMCAFSWHKRWVHVCGSTCVYAFVCVYVRVKMGGAGVLFLLRANLTLLQRVLGAINILYTV